MPQQPQPRGSSRERSETGSRKPRGTVPRRRGRYLWLCGGVQFSAPSRQPGGGFAFSNLCRWNRCSSLELPPASSAATGTARGRRCRRPFHMPSSIGVAPVLGRSIAPTRGQNRCGAPVRLETPRGVPLSRSIRNLIGQCARFLHSDHHPIWFEQRFIVSKKVAGRPVERRYCAGIAGSVLLSARGMIGQRGSMPSGPPVTEK